MNPLVITYALDGLLMIALPVVLGAVIARRMGVRWSLFGVGAATFAISQVVHLPFNAALGALAPHLLDPRGASGWHLLACAGALGLSAGLCEELARYGVLRWGIRSARSWKEGVMFGAGHGGVEAILFGTLVLVSLGGMMYLQSAGTGMVPAEHRALVDRQLAAYWSAPLFYPLIGALERVFALISHMAMALLVLQVFVRGRLFWLGIAILWHAGLDATAVFGMTRWGLGWCEVAIAAWAAAGLLVIMSLRLGTKGDPSE